MLLYPNGPQTSLYWFSQENNSCQELPVLINIHYAHWHSVGDIGMITSHSWLQQEKANGDTMTFIRCWNIFHKFISNEASENQWTSATTKGRFIRNVLFPFEVNIFLKTLILLMKYSFSSDIDSFGVFSLKLKR